jgi:hypothetical protein
MLRTSFVGTGMAVVGKHETTFVRGVRPQKSFCD